jgi:hypothetical protein
MCLWWMPFLAIASVRSQGVVVSVSMGAAPPPVPPPAPAPAFQPVVQEKRPRIPALVYYAPQSQWMERFAQQGEIPFSDGSSDIRLADPPDNFQYRIACGAESETVSSPWVRPERVDAQISYTSCRDLVLTNKIRYKTYNADKEYREVDFFPVPSAQIWRGVELRQGKTGIHSRYLSSCCRQSECPSVCLEFPEPQRCFLEIYTVSQGEVYEESVRADIARFFTGQSLTMQGGAFLRLRFKIPCDYCPLANCVTNCSNGEYATARATYQVRAHVLACVQALS